MSRLAAAVFLVLAASAGAEAVRVTDRDAAGRVVRTEDFSDGVPVWEVVFDPATGRPLAETSFRDGLPAEASELRWAGADLAGRTVKAADGAPLFEETLWRWPDGRLRRAQRTGADGEVSDTAWTYNADGKLSGAWTSEGTSGHREWSFGGGKTEQRLFEGPDEVLRRVTEWQAEGRSVETTEVPAGARVTVVTADGRNRPLTETVQVKDQVVSRRVWTYDPEGRPASLEVTAQGRSERRDFRYPDADTEITVVSRAGLTVKEETRAAGDLTQVRYFDRGLPFLTETYQGGRLVLETYFRDGKPVRERKR